MLCYVFFLDQLYMQKEIINCKYTPYPYNIVLYILNKKKKKSKLCSFRSIIFATFIIIAHSTLLVYRTSHLKTTPAKSDLIFFFFRFSFCLNGEYYITQGVWMWTHIKYM